MRYQLAAAAVGAAMCLPAATARADAIDGNWCSDDQRHFSIDGPRIVTPGGVEMTGEYDRHGFSYLVPEGERDAGARIVMTLMSEDVLHLTVVQGSHSDGSSELEVWRRCEVTS
jgi:hypothetical protein